MKMLSTFGKDYHNGFELKLFCGEEDALNSYVGTGERFRIVFVEEGSGILKIGCNRQLFSAPTVFCFNEQDDFYLECSTSLRTKAIWFHPCIINDAFDFHKVRKSDEEMSLTEQQDAFWINAFSRREEGFKGYLSVSPGTAKRISDIFDSIKLELDFQRDLHWPCRSRTFLIELLFLLVRVLTTTQSVDNVLLNQDPGDIGKIILYLHSNYMKKITIDELTKKFHVNRTTLAKRFNEVVGMPVMEYLIRLRIYLASQMLRDTLLPVSEVINRVGFNDPTHFGRVFRKHHGYAPTEYRDINCWMLK